MVARIASKDHILVTKLHITDFPTLIILKREEKNPILISEYVVFIYFLNITLVHYNIFCFRLRRLLLSDITEFLRQDSDNRINSNHNNQSDASSANLIEAYCENNYKELVLHLKIRNYTKKKLLIEKVGLLTHSNIFYIQFKKL